MPKLLWILATTFALASFNVGYAIDIEDKRQLEHEDYDIWNTLGSQTISNDGNWLGFSVTSGKGKSVLHIREIGSAKEFTVKNGRSLRFSHDSDYAIFVITPDADLLKKLRKEKRPESELPKPQLQILDLKTSKSITQEGVSSFTLPAKAAGWIAYRRPDATTKSIVETKSELNETFEITTEGVQRKTPKKKFRKPPAEPKPESKSKKSAESSKEKGEAAEKKDAKSKKKEKKNGSTLVVRSLDSKVEFSFPYVVSYRFTEQGTHLAFATSGDKGEQDGVHLFDLKKLSRKQVISGKGNYGQPTFSKDGKHFAFMSDRDDYEAEKSDWSLYVGQTSKGNARQIVEPKSESLPAGWHLSSSSAPLFSEDNSRLIFMTRPKPAEEKEDEEEVAKLDLWHWQDPTLQPQQLLNAARERNRSYEAVYDLDSRKVFQIATKEIPDVSINSRSSSDVAVGTANLPYRKMLSWDIQGFADWYLLNLKTGEHEMIAERHRGSPSASPSGKFIYWWDGEERTWFALATESPDMDKAVNLGAGIDGRLDDELHDVPALPGPYGIAGWLEDDAGLLIYDRWDIWLVDPSGEHEARCLTKGQGRENETIYRAQRLDAEKRFVELDQPVYLSLFDHQTKASGYASLTLKGQNDSEGDSKDAADDDEAESFDAWESEHELATLIKLDERVSGIRKAKDNDTVMFSRSTFTRSPDLWTSTLDFKTTRRMSRINPQQDNYRWGTAELVHWDATDGQPLDGILYKPDGFDPSKKYPLMVYFYERNSDNLHTYYVPEAERSIINFSFYVSRGYVVFIPDIPYSVGEPGPSAANAILPGVESIVEQGYIDPERIGMQGHSWGGYQTAYLVTVTDMFACAESGAPVSNMTSAYGGIRWGSGMSRMFQYEKTQSRIGGTLWEARDKYLANSPLFAADKVNTPLLILHNDEDTAVPWYQGIELFVALRRLEKPAWMLNYNGDPHWVMKDANRIDFAKRMQQFFDHYLLGDPMPVWMGEGIPAVKKGKEFGFEYLPEEEESEQSKMEEEAGAEETGEEETKG